MNDIALNPDSVNTAYATRTESGTLRLERVLSGPIERVWRYLTDSQKRGEWLATGDMDLRVGGDVELTWFNSRLTPDGEPTPEQFRQHEGHTMRGRITACDPPHLLAFTWTGGDRESEVRFELSERNGGVLLVLTHQGLVDRDGQISVASGWHSHLGILVALLEERTPPDFWRSYGHNKNEYQQRLSANA